MKIFIAAFCLLALSLNAVAQQRVVPIVEMKVRGVLGGVENGKFIDAKTTVEKLKGNENYTLFGIEGVNEGELSFSKPKNDQDVCTDFYYVEASEQAVSGVAIGDGFKWNIMPRTPKQIDLNDATYKKIVSDVLVSKGIKKPTVKITQAVRIDLDGDGQEEVLISATRWASGQLTAGAKVGDYSFVLMRKIVGGKVRNEVVTGEFINKKIDFGAVNEFEISAIVDLNGDGRMEVVLHSAYYEGSSSGAFEIKGNKLVEIPALQIGCGV